MDGRSSGSWSKTEPLVPRQRIKIHGKTLTIEQKQPEVINGKCIYVGIFFQFCFYPRGGLDCTVLLASTLLISRSPTGLLKLC